MKVVYSFLHVAEADPRVYVCVLDCVNMIQGTTELLHARTSLTDLHTEYNIVVLLIRGHYTSENE